MSTPSAVEVEARQGHVVLPARQPGEPPVGSVDDGERRPVAHAPHGALGTGRHQLAVLADQGSVGVEVEGGVVDGGAVGLTFLHPDHQVGTRTPGGGPERLGDRSRHDDGLVDEHRVPLAVTGPDRLGVDPDRRSGNERLGQHHDLGPGLGGGVQQRDRLVQTGLLVHQDVGRLHGGDCHGSHARVPLGGSQEKVPPALRRMRQLEDLPRLRGVSPGGPILPDSSRLVAGSAATVPRRPSVR